MNKPGPLLLVVDFQQSDHESEFPAGRPVVTELRPMGWWEKVKYRIRTRFSRQACVADNVYIREGLDVAIELSEDQYLKLVRGERDTSDAVCYLQGQPSLRLILPSKHDTDVPSEEIAGI